MSYTFYVFLYCVFLFFITKFVNRGNKEQLYLILILPVLVFVRSFVVTESIADLPVYKEGFQDIALLNIFNAKDIDYFNLYYKFEYGFIFFLKIVSYVTNDFNVMLCFLSCLFLGMYTTVFIRYSQNICLSILVLLVVFFDQSIFVLRQHMSIAVVLLSIPAMIERKPLRFVLIMTVAVLLHKSSLVWVIMYFFYGIKGERKIFLSMGLLIVAIGIIFGNLGYLNEQLSLGYSAYIDGEKSGHSNLVSFFISLSMFIVYVVAFRKKLFTEGIIKLSTLTLFVSVILSIMGINIGILSRFTLVFNTSLLFVIPAVYGAIKNGLGRSVYLFLSLGCYAYITYFGSFSKNMINTQLFVPDIIQMFWFTVLTLILLVVVVRMCNNRREIGWNKEC